jgi:DNA-binding CsgD family transcriptional regulator/N-acetylneuraminic acid mutarotase
MQDDLPEQDSAALTDREKEILGLLATGASNKDIARHLFISSNTVKVHLRNTFSKIGVSSRTEAAVYAIREGISQAADQAAAMLAPKELPTPTPISLESKKEPHSSWISALVTVILVGVITFGITTSQAPAIAIASPVPVAPPRWQEFTAMPAARSGLAVAVYENQIYAIGGETSQGVTGLMEQYDVGSDTWITLTSKPMPVADINAAVIGGQIFIPGGRLASGSVTDVLESYDPSRNEWESHASLPVALSGYALVAFEGKLYVFGGWDGINFLASVYEYDPDQDKWSVRSPMPTARGFAGAAMAGGKIYLIGGTDGKGALAVNEAYTPSREGLENPWESLKPMPSSRAHPGVASVADIVYILGSAVPEETLSFIAYLPQTDEWQAFENPPVSAENEFALISLGEYLYAVDGAIEGEQAGVMLAYRAVYTIGIPVIIK